MVYVGIARSSEMKLRNGSVRLNLSEKTLLSSDVLGRAIGKGEIPIAWSINSFDFPIQ